MCRAFEWMFGISTVMGLAHIGFDVGNDVFLGVAVTLGLIGMGGIIATYKG